VAHVTLFVVEYALVTLWKELGVVPRMLIGHSLGEYVAAAVAGVFSPKDALSLIVDRARLVDGLPAGGMLAVSLPRHEAACECVDGVAVAATNGPALTVLAGARDALRSIAQSLEERGIACRFLEASHAFHTAVMEPAAERLSERAATIELRPPKIPYVSNVTGRVMTAADACDPAYWGRHLCSPVRFHEGLRGVWSRLGDAVIEVGPGQTLSALVTQFSMSGEVEPRDVVATLNASPYVSGAVGSLLDVAGRCWLAGVELDDAAVERLSRTAGMKGEYAVRT
jgi:acyl transferase domain-containing protein